MLSVAPLPLAPDAKTQERNLAPPEMPCTFDNVYQRHAPFVWRAACRLGVAPSAAEDVVQDTFLVVHRHLGEYEERSSMRAWLFAILLRVIRDYRRTARRRPPHLAGQVDPDGFVDTRTPSPLEATERREAVEELYAILNAMSDERRDVFVLVELEELTVPEVARALAANVNTVYFRLRAARREFEKAVLRHRARNARSYR
jgi:RNA polymerase sigma-70 factor (ECF subfamily)